MEGRHDEENEGGINLILKIACDIKCNCKSGLEANSLNDWVNSVSQVISFYYDFSPEEKKSAEL